MTTQQKPKKSPPKPLNWGRTFKTAVQQGKSPQKTVEAIAKRNKVTEKKVWNWLVKNNFAFPKKFNGETFFFPCGFETGPKSETRFTEFNFWWFAVEFAFQQGWVTPQQVKSWTPKQTFWFLTNKFNAFYGKPANFNPQKKVPGFNFPNPFDPPTPEPKPAPKKQAKKTKPAPKPKAKKGTPKPPKFAPSPYAFPTNKTKAA